ncbi:MAG: hypothetical protein EXR43_03035 [Dehalococcoidia bacterium]|nr:hypothetical protein [Dehalococcoidia bacterium]
MTLARPRFPIISVIIVAATSFFVFALATLALRSGDLATTNYGVPVERWQAMREELNTAGGRAGFAVLYIRAIPEGGELMAVEMVDGANGRAVELTYVRQRETLLLREERRPWTVEDAQGTLIALRWGGAAALRELPTGETQLRSPMGEIVVTVTARAGGGWDLGTLVGLIEVVY